VRASRHDQTCIIGDRPTPEYRQINDAINVNTRHASFNTFLVFNGPVTQTIIHIYYEAFNERYGVSLISVTI